MRALQIIAVKLNFFSMMLICSHLANVAWDTQTHFQDCELGNKQTHRQQTVNNVDDGGTEINC